jgi:uncharacterized protein (TIGR02996 family)
MDDLFLRMIHTNPEDNTTRLVYADWLEEQSDPRSIFLRIEQEVVKVSVNEKNYGDLFCPFLKLARALDTVWVRQVSRVPIPPIDCRLRHAPEEWDVRNTRGEVELVNLVTEEVSIHFNLHPLQFLDLLVRDSSGIIRSESFYGNRFSPIGEMMTLRLKPGESYRHAVHLLGNVPEPIPTTGRYTIRASYQYGWEDELDDWWRTESDMLEIELQIRKR